MHALLRPGLFVVAAVVTGALLRRQAGRRGRRLGGLLTAEGAEWIALCRVMTGGHFLDCGRRRRGLGPRGTLLLRGPSLEWRPDAYEIKQGDQPVTWPVRLVVGSGRRRRRDITGIAFDEVRLATPDGEVTLGIFRQQGVTPAFLSPE